jgi:hypothetical protein
MLALFLTLATLGAEPSSEPIKLAAPPLAVVNIDPNLAEFYTNHLAQQLRFQGLQVYSQSDMAAVLGLERQQQLLGCHDDHCKAEVSDLLGVDGLVVGTVTRLEKTVAMDVRVIAHGTGQVLATVSSSTDTSDALVGSIVVIAQQLAQQTASRLGRTLDPRSATQIVRGGTLVKRLSWVPAVVGVAAGAAGAVELVMAQGSYSKLTKPQTPLLSGAQADAVAATGRTQQTVGLVAVGVGAAALVAAGAMFLFGGDELITTGVAIVPGQVSIGVSGVFP